MPFERPTLPQILDTVQADIEARLSGADARAPRSVLGVLARVQAGALHGLYAYLAWLSAQVLPDSAESEYLDRHAAVWGLARKAAAKAAGTVTLSGTNGTVVPAGTVLQTADGRRYATTAEATVAGGSATVSVEAKEAGAAGNADAGTTLTLVTPIGGLQSQGTVDAEGLGGGADIEDDDSLRTRLLARIQAPPHGGAAFDYVNWALEVEGVTRAWAYPQELGEGTVTVRVMTDGTTADGIPAQATIDAVQAHIDGLRPVTAAVTVVAPVAVPLDLEIAGLTPATADVKAAVEAEIADLIAREAEPGGTILVSHIREAISRASGEQDHRLVSPAGDVVHATGQIAVMGGVTWS